MTRPLEAFRRYRARRVWFRDPDRALGVLKSAPDDPGADPDSLALAAWLALVAEREPDGAERLARAALERGGEVRFASAALAEVLLRRSEHDEAIAVLRAAMARHPDLRWYELTLADALSEAGRTGEAEELLERAAADPDLRRHAVKRLSRWALERGDRERARRFFEELVDLAPDYLVYASDYAELGTLELEAGDPEAARRTWRRGAAVYPRNERLRELRHEHLGEDEPLAQPKIAPLSEEAIGARRIPIRTPLISSRTGLLPLLDEVSAAERTDDDVLVLAESAAAAGQGRLVPLELVTPGPLAHLLSRFVGKDGPLHSPEGMQGAIMELGRPRVALGALAALAGKALGRRGWFYRVGGPQAAMIDDVAACLPPHDHHLIFGPADPDGLATDLSGELGCGVAIVDANHRSGAWTVGASPGVDRRWLEAVLADNPAGNEDEQTPVVIVRALS
jgi:tetratricopeptide (TPR) repeat protein